MVTADYSGGASDMASFDLTTDNAPPTLAADFADVTVDEGMQATNSGTFSDPGVDDITLSASLGTVIDNGDGSWSWSWDTLDGPEDSATVTITATDSDGAATDVMFDLTVNNVAPVVSVGDDATAFADELFSQQISFTDPGNDAPWTVRIDWDGDATFDETIQTSDRDFQIAHTYGAIDIGLTYAVTVEVDDQDGGVDSDTFSVTVRENTFRVSSFVQHPSGFDIQFNRSLDIGVLNLYDGDDVAIDLPDMSLVGTVAGAITGSAVWDASTNTLSFVSTGGVLGDDSYTVTLNSSGDAFQDLMGNLLDGDADYMSGGNFEATFDVTHGADRVVSIGDFARGADQVIDLTPEDALDLALPVVIDNAEGVLAVDLHIVYDPTLLTIADVTLVDSLPPDWTITVNNTVPGRVLLTASGITPLSGTNVAIYDVDASVPSAAPYGASQTIRLENLRLNEDQIPSVADVAVHHAVYLSDATGNGQLTALDASLISRVVVALDSGFDAHQLIDPLIVADVTGDGTLSGLDVSLAAQNAVGLLVGKIPDDPYPLEIIVPDTGPQRVVSIESGLYSAPWGMPIEIPVAIDDAGGLLGADFTFRYDTTTLSFVDLQIDNQPGGFMDGWTLFSNPDDSLGVVRVALVSAMPHDSGAGELLTMDFVVEPTAPMGTTALDVEGELNEGGLEIVSVDGDFTVPGGDFNNDGLFNCDDIDALVGEIANQNHSSLYDLTGDGNVDLADRDAWLALAATANGLSSPYLVGDANLDGMVDAADFAIWNSNKFTSVAAWCAADFNADGFVDGRDLLLWNQNKSPTGGNRSSSQPTKPQSVDEEAAGPVGQVNDDGLAAAPTRRERFAQLFTPRPLRPARVDDVLARWQRTQRPTKNETSMPLLR